MRVPVKDLPLDGENTIVGRGRNALFAWFWNIHNSKGLTINLLFFRDLGMIIHRDVDDCKTQPTGYVFYFTVALFLFQTLSFPGNAGPRLAQVIDFGDNSMNKLLWRFFLLVPNRSISVSESTAVWNNQFLLHLVNNEGMV